jgi:hypothetical protein
MKEKEKLFPQSYNTIQFANKNFIFIRHACDMKEGKKTISDVLRRFFFGTK